MAKLWRDLQSAIRNLYLNPMLTAVALLSLALGIGANTAIFSLLNAVVLRPLPIPHPEQLVTLTTWLPENLNDDDAFTWPLFIELSRAQQVFSDFFAWDGGGLNNFEVDGAHYSTSMAAVSATYYRGMQTVPMLGRFIGETDTATNNGQSSAVAVISYRAWRNWFHGSSDIIGRVIRVGSHPFTVIGVEPEGFAGLTIDAGSDVTIPLFAPGAADDRSPSHLRYPVFGRLKPGVTLEQARQSLVPLWPRLLKLTEPPDYSGEKATRFFSRKVRLASAATGISYLRRRFTKPLQMMMALVGTVLFIACMNIANLSLFKAAAYRHQTGVRAALGASVWDLVRPLLLESLLLSFGGALLGMSLAYWASHLILTLAWTGYTQTSLSVSPDWRVLGFTFAITLITGLLFGTVPALYAARTDPINALKQSNRSISGGANALGKMLLVMQIALSLVLLLSALFFSKTLTSLHQAETGFRRDHILTLQLFPQAGSPLPQAPIAYYRNLAQKVMSVPGVQSVSYSWSAPVNRYENLGSLFRSLTDSPVTVVWESAGPGFFSLLGMHFLAGSDVSWEEAGRASPPAVISKSLADHLFGAQNAIGRTIYIGSHAHAQPLTITGVVNNASLWKVDSVRPMFVFTLFEPNKDSDEPLMDVRTSVDPTTLKQSIEKMVRSLGHHYSLRTETVEERLDGVLAIQRLTAILAGCFGGVALIISCVGLYGLMSFQMTRRTTELGMRSALGAGRSQLLIMVLREAMSLALYGCVIGIVASLATGRALQSLLYGVSVSDPKTLLMAVAAMLTVAGLAGFLPARRAALVDPLRALRAE